jgi:hypothetical protein
MQLTALPKLTDLSLASMNLTEWRYNVSMMAGFKRLTKLTWLNNQLRSQHLGMTFHCFIIDEIISLFSPVTVF